MLIQSAHVYLSAASLSTNAGLLIMVVRGRISRRKERDSLESKLAVSDRERHSVSVQLRQRQTELAAARAVMDSRSRFIADIKPLLKRLAGDAADYRAQSEVLEEQVRLLCEEDDANEAAKEREARVDLGVDVAQIIVEHA